MKIFSKKQDDELFSLINAESMETSENCENESIVSSGHIPAHALTPQEVISSNVSNCTNKEASSALESLKKRMHTTVTQPKPVVEDKQSDLNLNQKPLVSETNKTTQSSDVKKVDITPDCDGHKKTLLEKCKPYIVDDDGKDAAIHTAPTYRLESVADILHSESQKALERLSEKYDISFDDLGNYKSITETKPAHKPKPQPVIKTDVPEKEVFEDALPVKNVQKSSNAATTYVISDIDTYTDPLDSTEKAALPESNATIKFTPVSDGESRGSRISVSSQTHSIDLTGELTQLSDDNNDELYDEVRLEQSEFEEYVPAEEFTGEKDLKKFLRLFSLRKRNSFLVTFFSFLLTIILVLMKLPFLSAMILENTKILMIICTSVTGIIILLNISMFKALGKIFRRKSTADVSASLASVAVISYSVIGILKNEITIDILIFLAFILSIRALSRFFSDSYMLASFRQISASSSKRAIKLISDPAVTFAMAKNAIEGDTLIAAPQRAGHVDGFMKYSTYSTFFGGKLPAVTILSLLLSIITGFATASYYNGIVYGFYSAAAMQCFAALPVIFFIDSLPLYSAAKKLSKNNAMISGKTGAEHIEMANAVVFSSEDIFPAGTVTLHQMKVLSENSIDDTIIRAASLTDCLGSTLSPIFKQIAGTGNIEVLPDSDTVKYEDRMGISGWVDNRLLFIGNRSLMEAHGISVPSVSIDHKILRQGYFPVYVATQDKACALLVIQYTVKPEIAKEMRKISSMGITMLINNSDPNLSEEMICDYFGLYDDSVKIMSNAGCHMYKNAVSPAKSIPAPGMYRGNPLGLAAIINCAARIKKSSILLTVIYIIAAVFGAILFAYTSFDGSGSLINGTTLLLYGLICTVVSYILYLTEKP